MSKYIFGVDLGGTTAKIGFFEKEGKLLDSWEIPTRKEQGGSLILPDIANAVQTKLQSMDLDNDDVIGIGLGVPGPVGSDGTVFKCVNLGWDVFNVAQELSDLTDIPVKAGNDANIAALGEMWQGGGKGFRDVIMVTLGTGVGGGIIIDGRIAVGACGASGEIGHIPVVEPEECPDVCGCGKRGCLEQYVSANGIVRMTRRFLEAYPDMSSSLRGYEKYGCKDIFAEAAKGDAAASEMVERFYQILGKALAGIACVINTEIFVIGGGVSNEGPALIEGIEKYFRKYSFHASRDTKFTLATLGNSAGIYGGAGLFR